MNSTTETSLEITRVLRMAAGALVGRVSVPLSLLRKQLASIAGKATLAVEPASPGLRIRGKAHALGAPISFSARIDADGVLVIGEQRVIRITLSDVELTTAADAPGPLADAIREGMIDTQNPATLLGNMMSLPDFIVEAEGRTVLIDLLRIPAVAKDEMLQAAVAAATSYLCVTAIVVRKDSIDLQLGILPGGVKEAAFSTARAALTPVIQYLWPSGRQRP